MNEPLSTETRIKNSFLEQLNLIHYSKITMKGIAESLDMSRQNLYRHYSSKEDILGDIAEDLLEQVLVLFDQTELDSSSESWKLLLDHAVEIIYQQRDYLVPIFKSDTDEITFRFLKSFVTRVLGRLARQNNIVISDHDYFELIVWNLTGASFYVVKNWASSDMKVPLEKVKIIIHDSFVDPVEKLRLCDDS